MFFLVYNHGRGQHGQGALDHQQRGAPQDAGE